MNRRFLLIVGEHLARSVRGRPGAPPCQDTWAWAPAWPAPRRHRFLSICNPHREA
jgi:hypothetical protein